MTAAAFTPDGRTLVTGGDDGDAIVWDVRQRAAAETLSGHTNGIVDLQITRDGRTLYTAGLDGTVLISDLSGRRRIARPFKAGAGDDGRPQVTLSSDGRLLAMGQDDGAVSVVELRTLARRAAIPVVAGAQVAGMAFVPGSHLLVVGGANGFLALVDADSARVVRRLPGHRGYLWTPGVSADGTLLATGSEDGTVRLWSLPDGSPLGVPLRYRDEALTDVQLSPDGRRLAIGLVDRGLTRGAFEIWDARARRRLFRERFADYTSTPRFSPDGKLIVVSSRFGRAQVWSTANWKPVTRWLQGEPSSILTEAISPDNRTLVTANDTGAVRLWDVETEQALGAPLPGVPSRYSAATFTPDGKHLIASYDNGRAYLWDIRQDSLVRQACRVAGRQLTRAEWEEFLPGRDFDPAC